MNRTAITLLIAFISISYSYSQKCNCLDFIWQGDTISGRYVPKASMAIPVTIDDLPHKYTMQLDLGAVTTQLYQNSLQPYLDVYPSLKGKIDSTKTFMSNNEEHIMLAEMNLNMGDIVFKNINIGLLKGYGDSLTNDSVNTKSTKHIGTIAPDIFQDKVISIDYPNNKICLSNEVTEKHSDAKFMDMSIDHGRIKIPFNIDGNTEMLMFDTGSSLFPLITSETKAFKISSGIITDSLRVNSWGNLLPVYGSNITKKIKFGGETLPSALVYYIDIPQIESFFESEKIWGITGNAYFTENTLIIDYKNKKIAIN